MKRASQSRLWQLFCFLAYLHVEVAHGSEGCSSDKDQFMMTTFMVPTADIERYPEKYLEIPEIKEVPTATLKVTYTKYKRVSTTRTTATNITAEVRSSQMQEMPKKISFLSPDIQGPGGKVLMKLPFYVSAEYDVDNYLPKQAYPCKKKTNVTVAYTCNKRPCKPYDCNPYKCDGYKCHEHDCNPYDCKFHNCRCYHGGFLWLQWKCDTCHEKCYHTCHHTCYRTCFKTCHQTCFDTCTKTQEKTEDDQCFHEARGCKRKKVKLGWKFDVVTEVDLSTMEPKTLSFTGLPAVDGECRDEVDFDVKPVAEKIAENLRQAGFLYKMLNWQNKSYPEENATIYYRYQNVSVDGTASTVYGSVLGCVKSEANQSLFRPEVRQRGVESRQSRETQWGEPILPSTNDQGTLLRKDWVVKNASSTASAMTFKVAGVGSTWLRLYGNSGESTDRTSYWEVEFHTSPVQVTASLRVITGNCRQEGNCPEKKDNFKGSLPEHEWHLSISNFSMTLYLGQRGSEPFVQLKSTTTTTATTTTTTTTTSITTTTVTTTTTYLFVDWPLTLSTRTTVKISYNGSIPQPQGGTTDDARSVFPLNTGTQVQRDPGYASVAFKFQEWKDDVSVKLPRSNAVKLTPCNFTFLFERRKVSIKSYCPGRNETVSKKYNSSKTLFIQVAKSLQEVAVGEGGQRILVWRQEGASPEPLEPPLPHVRMARRLAISHDGKGMWPGMPDVVRVFRGADSNNTWQFKENHMVRDGHLPDRLWDDPAHAAVRVSATLLEALVWARMMKGVVLVNNHNTVILDANFSYSANVSRPRLDLGNDTNLSFKLAEAHFRTRCKSRSSSLISAEFSGLSGAGQVFVRRGKDKALDFSVGFDDRGLDHFKISNPLLHEPHIPMNEKVLNFNLRKLMHFLTPMINEKLQQMPFTLHKDYAQVIPCNHALSPEDSCPTKLRKVSVEATANFAYLQIQAQQATPPTKSEDHDEQDAIGLPVVLPWGQPVYAFSLPSQFSWLCLRCSKTLVVGTGLFGLALALFAVFQAKCCEEEEEEEKETNYQQVRNLDLAELEGEEVTRDQRTGQVVSTMRLVLVALSLILHSIFWSVADPFVDFSMDNLRELGVGESFNVEGAVGQLQSWTGLGTCITLLEGFAVMMLLIIKPLQCQFLKPILTPIREHWPHIQLYVCMLALFTQAMLIIGLPMLVTVGQVLACKVDESDDRQCALEASSTAMLVMAVTKTAPTIAKAIKYQSTIVNAMFTCIFLSYLGIYFTFFILAAGLGTYVDSTLFGLLTPSRGRASDLAAAKSWSVFTDVLTTVTLLGPFVVFFQTLGGSSWWYALLLGPSILRPTVVSLVKPQSLWTKVHLMVLTCGSCLAAGCLWVDVTRGLQTISILQVSRLFTCSMCCSVAITAAVGMYVACENLGSNHRVPQEWIQQVVEKLCQKLDPSGVLKLFDTFEHSDKIQRISEFLAGHAPISWLLSMDALATLFYHFFKTLYLGWMTQCFYNWSLTGQALWVRFNHKEDFEEWLRMNFRSMTPNQRDLPMAPDVALTWPASIALFLVCVIASSMTSKFFYRYQTKGSDGHDDDDPTVGDETVRRSEFLIVGLGHWSLTFIRRKMEQQAMPHNFNLANVPIGLNLTDNMILQNFHKLLIDHYGLQMPTDDITIFDDAYLSWDKFSAMMLHVEGWALFMVLLATLLHNKRLQCSRFCVLCAAILAGSAGLLQLLPNYIAELGLDPYYEGCGTSYDAYMKLLLNVIFGSAISALLGWKVFSNLLTLPISLVRGIWLFLLEEKDTVVRSDLSCLMRYLAIIMPLINAFPLLFVSQLTESRLVWQPLLGFWLLPQLWIVGRPDSSYMQWSFYPIWLCLYLGFFCWFVYIQIDVLDLHIWRTLQNLDMPYIWSLLHAEFCIMNVLVTDMLELTMRRRLRRLAALE